MRSSSTAADTRLRRVLAGHLVDDPDAPANYSLQLLPPPGPGAATSPLHRLFEGPWELVRDRSPAQVVGALLTALGGFARPDGAHLQLWATALAGPQGAVLAPSEWRRRLPALQRPLRRAGWTILDVPFVSLDLYGGEVVLPEPPLLVDAAALSEFADEAPPRPASPPAGPYPLRGWLLPPAGGVEHVSKVAALVAVMGLCRNRDAVGGRRAFALLADRVRAVPVTRAPRTFADAEAADLLAVMLGG